MNQRLHANHVPIETVFETSHLKMNLSGLDDAQATQVIQLATLIFNSLDSETLKSRGVDSSYIDECLRWEALVESSRSVH